MRMISEGRREGKASRSRWSPDHQNVGGGAGRLLGSETARWLWEIEHGEGEVIDGGGEVGGEPGDVTGVELGDGSGEGTGGADGGADGRGGGVAVADEGGVGEGGWRRWARGGWRGHW